MACGRSGHGGAHACRDRDRRAGAIEREDQAPRPAACHLENRTQREQANESMCECAMGEVRRANAVHIKLNQWTHTFRRKAPVKDMRDEAERNERDGRGQVG